MLVCVVRLKKKKKLKRNILGQDYFTHALRLDDFTLIDQSVLGVLCFVTLCECVKSTKYYLGFNLDPFCYSQIKASHALHLVGEWQQPISQM